jgi:GT2 family glycosyltransferase
MPSVSVVICTLNREALLRECLASIARMSDPQETEIIVVDNGSVDDTVAMVRREFPTVRLLVQSKNVGFCVANNIGVAASSAPYVMLLNSDAVLLSDTAGNLVRFLKEHDDVKCVGPRIVLPSGERQPRVFGNLPSLWRIAMQSLYLGQLFPRTPAFEGIDGRDRPGPVDDVGWISGVCMVMRRLDFIAAGGFDPTFFIYCEDVDLCSRLSQRGGRIVRVDADPVLHYGGGSSPLISAQLRNSLLQQRNLLKVVRGRSGRLASGLAALLISLGLLLRIAVGVARIPTRGIQSNVLLRSSWVRIRDLVMPVSMPVAR